MSLVTFENVALGYDGNVVVHGLHFSVEEGDYVCIVGENGAGKSTMIKGLLGLKSPTSGRILLGDGLKRKEIGYLPQQTDMQKDFPASVFEVVLSGRLNTLGWRPFYSRNDKRIAEEKLAIMGMSAFKRRCYHDLSGGQQQRVLLARALCATKKLLLLDEPTAGLDPKVTNELYELIARINKEENITIIMVSHDIHSAVTYSNKILHLAKTQQFFGDVEDYKRSDIGKLFLGREALDRESDINTPTPVVGGAEPDKKSADEEGDDK